MGVFNSHLPIVIPNELLLVLLSMSFINVCRPFAWTLFLPEALLDDLDLGLDQAMLVVS